MSIDLIPVPYAEPLFPMAVRNDSSVTDCVIHHTAGALTQTPLDIDAEHRALNPPDAMIAYNAVITPDGKAYAGRPAHFIPAATYGRNTESYAIVLVGNFEPGSAGYTGNPTNAQIVALYNLVLQVHLRYPITRTYGHGDVAALFYGGDPNYATACPGRNLSAEIPLIRKQIAQRLARH